jgi:hypothetical protein
MIEYASIPQSRASNEVAFKTTPAFDFTQPQGKNSLAYSQLLSGYRAWLQPLSKTFENDPGIQFSITNEKRLIISSEALEKLRTLEPIEEGYIRTVRELSFFNPKIFRVFDGDTGVTQEVIKLRLERKVEETLTNIEKGENYFPYLIIGAGVHGTIALGEINRINGELASQTIMIDSTSFPGGPFGIPNGPAWDLNSANSRGSEQFVLPDLNPSKSLSSTIRGYGSPLRFTPGERNQGVSVRSTSINTIVDYVLPPDSLSEDRRYASNEDLANSIQAQVALLNPNLILNATIINIQHNTLSEKQGLYKITLDTTKGLMNIYVDGFNISSGLGTPYYGFKLEKTNLNRILEMQRAKVIEQKVFHTLDAFKVLASRTSEIDVSLKTVIIYGDGNSAETLIENLGNLFKDSTSQVKTIEKIIVISKSGEFSQRPRYLRIKDLQPRNGEGNLLEIIKGRIGDITLSNNQISVLDDKGNEIVDSSGKVIKGDIIIAATGFRNNLSNILTDEKGVRIYNDEEGLKSELDTVTLPTNRRIEIAQTIPGFVNSLITGTASNSFFENKEKLNQLPKLSRDALLRNGAENAVAIGFRGPDTQAAIRIFLSESEIISTLKSKKRTEKTIIQTQAPRTMYQRTTGDILVNFESSIPNNVTNYNLAMTAILNTLLAEFNSKFKYNTDLFTFNTLERKLKRNKSYANREIVQSFELRLDQELNLFFQPTDTTLKDRTGSPLFILELEELLALCIQNKYFQKYAIAELKRKRSRSKQLKIQISLKDGNIDYSNTFVESGLQ